MPTTSASAARRSSPVARSAPSAVQPISTGIAAVSPANVKSIRAPRPWASVRRQRVRPERVVAGAGQLVHERGLEALGERQVGRHVVVEAHAERAGAPRADERDERQQHHREPGEHAGQRRALGGLADRQDDPGDQQREQDQRGRGRPCPGMCSAGVLTSMSTATPTAGADQLHARAPQRRSASCPISTAPAHDERGAHERREHRGHYRERLLPRAPPLYARRL